MDTNSLQQPIFAVVSKHHVAGIVGMVIGAVLVVVGAFRVIAKTAGAAIVPIAGAVVVVLGIMTYAHVI